MDVVDRQTAKSLLNWLCVCQGIIVPTIEDCMIEL